MDQIINLCPLKTHIHGPLPLHSGVTPHPLQQHAAAQTRLKKCSEHKFIEHKRRNWGRKL